MTWSGMTQTPPAGWYADPDNSAQQRYWDGSTWTEERQDRVESPPPPPPPPMASPMASPPKKKKRIFLWFFLAVQLLFIIWIIAGASSGSNPSDCAGLDADTCKSASDVGTGIGVFLIFIFWIFVDFLLGLIYGIYRLAKRT
jgi:hypothetical protein